MEEVWSNTDQILQKNGVTKVQAALGMFVVISLSRPTQPHNVNASNGGVRCDCKVFKSRNICPHAIAVAHSNGELQELIVKWEPNLSNLVQFFIPKANGRKPGQKRNLFSCAVEQHDVSPQQDPLEDADAFAKREPYYLQWLQGSKVTTFYGCGKKFRPSLNDPSPPEPYYVEFCWKQVRVYTPKESVGLHFKLSCVEMKNADGISADSLATTSHKMMLRKEYGIIVVQLCIL